MPVEGFRMSGILDSQEWPESLTSNGPIFACKQKRDEYSTKTNIF